MRQWVFVLPFDLHVRVAHDDPLESTILGLFMEKLTAHVRAATEPAVTLEHGLAVLEQLLLPDRAGRRDTPCRTNR